jgi:hypothetical protein
MISCAIIALISLYFIKKSREHQRQLAKIEETIENVYGKNGNIEYKKNSRKQLLEKGYLVVDNNG